MYTFYKTSMLIIRSAARCIIVSERKRFSVIGLLAVSMLIYNAAAYSPVEADSSEAISCVCPKISPEWEVVPDTLGLPSTIIDPHEIRRIIICKHGLFLYFRAGENHKYRYWWLGYTPPRAEQYRSCIEKRYSGKDLDMEVEKAGREAMANYWRIRKDVRSFLGRRYREGKVIHFDRSYKNAPFMENCWEVNWRGKTLQLGNIPELFYKPN